MGIVLTWNVAGRVGPNQERQIDALAERSFDVLCLQEVTPRTRARWIEALGARGLHVAVSEWPVPPAGTRRFAVLVASGRPVTPRPVLALPWPERHLAVRTAIDGAEVEIHTLHAPLSSKEELAKVRTLEALHAQLAAADDGIPRILAGDLNTPRYENREGEIVTFARDRKGRLREELGERHDRAELLLIDGLVREQGWRDAFRAVHGYGRRDRSWAMRTGFGWRLDHVLVSPGLAPVDADYVHDWRTERLSDHSALWARIERDG
jgi:endonuclease/exonuclease/phosphatase family metal-dependent hydrolase